MTGAAGIQRKSVKTNMEIHDNISDQIFSPNPIKIEFFFYFNFFLSLQTQFTIYKPKKNSQHNFTFNGKKQVFEQNAVGRISAVFHAPNEKFTTLSKSISNLVFENRRYFIVKN